MRENERKQPKAENHRSKGRGKEANDQKEAKGEGKKPFQSPSDAKKNASKIT